ncbi:MAG: hypothetical protein LRZ87_02370 [Methanocellales archaeon]|nr:hypothetical protein [Methanocellales archaeon]
MIDIFGWVMAVANVILNKKVKSRLIEGFLEKERRVKGGVMSKDGSL